MTIKILFFITLLAYSIVVSQSFMYILALKDTQLNLGVNAYIELRKLIDVSMRAHFTYVVYAALISNLVLVILTLKKARSLVFITAVIAFIALIADTLITVNGNLPINDIINSWSSENPPPNWAEYRTKWLNIFSFRQMANITGFISLLVGAVFGLK